MTVSVLIDRALEGAQKSGDNLEHVLELTRAYEEIALQTELDDASPNERARLFGLVARGATALSGLLLRSIEAEEQGDLLIREQVDEVGSRLQSVTTELARLCEKGN